MLSQSLDSGFRRNDDLIRGSLVLVTEFRVPALLAGTLDGRGVNAGMAFAQFRRQTTGKTAIRFPRCTPSRRRSRSCPGSSVRRFHSLAECRTPRYREEYYRSAKGRRCPCGCPSRSAVCACSVYPCAPFCAIGVFCQSPKEDVLPASFSAEARARQDILYSGYIHPLALPWLCGAAWLLAQG